MVGGYDLCRCRSNLHSTPDASTQFTRNKKTKTISTLLLLCQHMKDANSFATPSALEAFKRLLEIVDELRKKCPWDREQTIESLRYLTVEETHELSEAIISGDTTEIKKELGDLLLHIMLYARIASEKQTFTITELIQALCEKLIYRHPHIYGQEEAQDTKSVAQNWEKLKLKEHKNKSVLGGVPNSLPSLLKAVRIQEKARGVGLSEENPTLRWEKVHTALQKITPQGGPSTSPGGMEAWGTLLFALADYAKATTIDPEEALERANQQFIKRFKSVEQSIRDDHQELAELTPQQLQKYWKAIENE